MIFLRDQPYLRDQSLLVEVGRVLVMYSRHLMYQKLSQIQTPIVATILLLLTCLFTATYFLLRHMVQKPVQQLVAMTNRIADGDFETRIPVSSSDEIGVLQI